MYYFFMFLHTVFPNDKNEEEKNQLNDFTYIGS